MNQCCNAVFISPFWVKEQRPGPEPEPPGSCTSTTVGLEEKRMENDAKRGSVYILKVIQHHSVMFVYSAACSKLYKQFEMIYVFSLRACLIKFTPER